MSALLLALLLSQAAEPVAEPVAGPVPESDLPRAARDTADVGPAGRWSAGFFNPTRLAIADSFELEFHPILFFVAPNLVGRFALSKEAVRVTIEAGLLVPTFGMRLTKGYLFPTWATSANDIGWMVIPRIGVLISGNVRKHDVWTLRADYAGRVLLGRNSATPLESFLAPLDLLMAAPTTGFLGGFGGAYDAAITQRLRLRAAVNFYVSGAANQNLYVDGNNLGPLAPRDPFIITTHVGLDVAVFKHSRITIGMLWGNYDQGATAIVLDKDGFAERVRGRSNNFLPTLDYIWAGGFGD
ncbi:MAG: hypothetical protein H6Q89_4829 [Myxococcaceae bacterium]|nr:hypothetical protein [Myxococcaceae bacterium]